MRLTSRTREKKHTYVASAFHSAQKPLSTASAYERTIAQKVLKLLDMYAAESLPAVALAWAERQAGVLSRDQLISFGLSDSQIARLSRQQVLLRLDRGSTSWADWNRHGIRTHGRPCCSAAGRHG